ncbi:unnamed protein product [Amoebophrya sp. A25]|nr:unnamed protein product [Amoebophrya sp. A25]|eukprot:GSA25T00007183001.1
MPQPHDRAAGTAQGLYVAEDVARAAASARAAGSTTSSSSLPRVQVADAAGDEEVQTKKTKLETPLQIPRGREVSIASGGNSEPVSRSTRVTMSEEMVQQVRHNRKTLVTTLQGHSVRFRTWFLITFTVNILVATATLALWSMIGYGSKCYKWAIEQDYAGFYLWYGGIFILFVLYMLDFFTCPLIPHADKEKVKVSSFRFAYGDHRGQSACGTIVCRCLAICSFLMALAWGITAAGRYPHYPVMIMLVALMGLQVAARFAKRLHYYDRDTIAEQLKHLPDGKMRLARMRSILINYLLMQHDKLIYYKAACISTLVTATLVFNLWLYWAFVAEDKNYWSKSAREKMRNDGLFLESETTGITADDTLDISPEQLFNVHFNIWAAPVLLAVGYLLIFGLLGLRCYLHVSYTKTDEILTEVAHSVATEDANHGDSILGVGNMDAIVDTVKLCVCGLFATALTFWVAAEVGVGASNSSLDVSTTVRTFIGAVLFSFVVVIAATMQRVYKEMVQNMWRNPFLRMMVDFLRSEWLKALFLLLFWWSLPVYYAISAVNRFVRYVRGTRDRNHYDDTSSEGSTEPTGAAAESSNTPGDETTKSKPATEGDASSTINNFDSKSLGARSSQEPEEVPLDRPTQKEEEEMKAHQKVHYLPSPWHHYCTRRCSMQLGGIAHWNATGVITKAYIWGIAFFVLNVGCTKGLNLGLIGLNVMLDGLSPLLVMLFWYLAGLGCFLLPPVPGPPVYLFGGLVVVDAFEKANTDDPETGFWLGLALTCVVSLILKLHACAMQQKAIGEPLGSREWIRALVGVHTPTIRAIEVVLRQPGLGFGKCAILCGGPDWPTSVLCGILQCSLLQIMIGTAPIFVFVSPTVMTGAFKRKTDKIFVTLTSLLLLFSVLLACAMGVAACYAVQEVMDNHGPLLQVPLDANRELHWIDFKGTKKREIYEDMTRWPKLAWWKKAIMLVGVLAMSFQCFVFFWNDSECWGQLDLKLSKPDDYSLYWNFSPEPDNPKDIHVLKPTGQFTLAVFGGGCLFYYIVSKMLSAMAAKGIADFEAQADELRADWDVEQDIKRDEIERELCELYPDDYAAYLEQTGRPELMPLDGEDNSNSADGDDVVDTSGALGIKSGIEPRPTGSSSGERKVFIVAGGEDEELVDGNDSNEGRASPAPSPRNFNMDADAEGGLVKPPAQRTDAESNSGIEV